MFWHRVISDQRRLRSGATFVEAPHIRTFEGFKGFTVIQVAEDHIVLIITGTGLDVLDRFATEVRSPWMKANIVPLLSRPPERVIGPVVVDMGIPASN